MAAITDVDLEALTRMRIDRLQALHRVLFGAEHPVSNAWHIRSKIAWHVQAQRYGGLPDSARQRALAVARESELRVRISDNVSRRKKGVPRDRTVTTCVAPTHDAREYDGRRFGSLSAVAQEITGTKWNGYRRRLRSGVQHSGCPARGEKGAPADIPVERYGETCDAYPMGRGHRLDLVSSALI